MSEPVYVVVSPARNEARYIQSTIDSVTQQTLKPARWIIVNDGSSDATGQILYRASENYPWITVIERADRGFRNNFGGEIQAFMEGYRLLEKLQWNFVVKLDCDLEFGPRYFQELLSRFELDAKLGIASGVYLEARRDGWTAIGMPPHHAAGACKVVRRECFSAIKGFLPERGWDTIDEIRAINAGWRTCHFRDLEMKHLKPEGSGNGYVRTCVKLGEVYYLTGGSKRFFTLKVAERLFRRPLLVGAVGMLWGYLKLFLSRERILVTPAEARCYRALLHARIIRRLRGTLHLQ